MLNIGVIGCGGMGRDHIKRIAERTQGAQVVAVADMVESIAKKVRSSPPSLPTRSSKLKRPAKLFPSS